MFCTVVNVWFKETKLSLVFFKFGGRKACKLIKSLTSGSYKLEIFCCIKYVVVSNLVGGPKLSIVFVVITWASYIGSVNLLI